MNFIAIMLLLTFFSCRKKEELIISEIEISLENKNNNKDSIESMLNIYVKPFNENVFFPSHLILKDSISEYKIYLNSFNSKNYLKSYLLYNVEYKKIKNENEFEKLKKQIIQSDFYLPNKQKLKKDKNYQINKSNFENLDIRYRL
ncbi:MAG: hypothetical protein ACRC8Z_00080 [Empedobacter falsenii]